MITLPPGLRKTSILGLKVFAFAAVAYLVGINALLNSGLLPRIINKAANLRGEVVHLDFKAAWMGWPGRLRVSGFTLRGQAKDVQWYLTIDQAHVRVDLSALVSKKFRATQVDADGVTFRLRPRLPATAAKNAADFFAPIPGFEAFPILGDQPDWVPSGDELKQLVQVELEQVQVHGVRDVWLADYHWQGVAEAAGNFAIRPPEWVELAPTSLVFESGTLSVGSDVIVPDFKGRLEAAIDRCRPVRGEPLQMIPCITTNIRFGGTLRSLRFLHRSLPALDQTSVAARFDTDLKIVRGKLVSGIPLTLDLPQTKLHFKDYELSGAVQAKVAVTEENQSGLAHVDLGVSSIALRRTGTDLPLLLAPGIRIQANVDDLDLSHGMTPAWFEAEIKQADFTDLSFVNALVPAGTDLEVLSGKGRLGGRVAWGVHSGLAEGEIEWVSDGTKARFGKTELSGDFAVHAKLADFSMPGGKSKALPDSQFELVAKGLKVNSGATHLNTSARVLGALEVDAEGKHGRVALDLGTTVILSKGQATKLTRIPELKLTLDLPKVGSSPALLGLRATIPDLRLLNAYLPEMSILEVTGGSADLDGHAQLSKDAGDGKVVMVLKRLSATAAELGGAADVRLEMEGGLEGGKLSLKPFQLRVDRGQFQVGSESVVRNLECKGTWDPQSFMERLPTKGVLAALTAKLRFNGNLDGVRFLNRYLKGPLAPTLDGGGGPFSFDAVLTRGQLAVGSQFTLDAKAIRSTWAQYYLQGSIHFAASVGATGGAPNGALSLVLSPFAMHRTGESNPMAAGKNLRVDAPFKTLELTQDFLDIPVVVALPPTTITDLSFINLFLPKKSFLSFSSGEGQVTGRLELGTGAARGHGSIQLTTKDIQAYYSEIKLKGNVQAKFELSEMSLSRGEFELARSFITLEGIRVDEAERGGDPWKGAIEFARAKLNVGARRLEGAVHGHFKNARPIIAVFNSTAALPPVVTPFLQLKGLDFDASLLMVPSIIDVTLPHMKGGPFEAKGWLQVRDGLKTGVLLINSGRLSVGVGVHDDVPVVQLKNAPAWFQKHGHPSALDPSANSSPENGVGGSESSPTPR